MIDYRHMKLSLNQIDDMRHAVGLEVSKLRKGQRKYTAYRNHFVASARSDEWDELCFYGLADWAADEKWNQIFYKVTPDGLKLLEYIYDVSIEVI